VGILDLHKKEIMDFLLKIKVSKKEEKRTRIGSTKASIFIKNEAN
jgi:hypothetical protein